MHGAVAGGDGRSAVVGKDDRGNAAGGCGDATRDNPKMCSQNMPADVRARSRCGTGRRRGSRSEKVGLSNDGSRRHCSRGGLHRDRIRTLNAVRLQAFRDGLSVEAGDDGQRGHSGEGAASAREPFADGEEDDRGGDGLVIFVLHLHDGFAGGTLPDIVERVFPIEDNDVQHHRRASLHSGGLREDLRRPDKQQHQRNSHHAPYQRRQSSRNRGPG